jgi:hypothetical protein
MSLRIGDATFVRQDVFAGSFAVLHEHAGELDHVVHGS